MANEINVLIDASLDNGLVTHRFSPGSFSVDQTNARKIDFIQNVGVTEESVTLTDFNGNGLIFLQNLDPTNYVEFGLTGSYTGRLVSGDPPAAFRLNTGATLYLKANSAACDVQIVAYDV